MPRLPTSLLLKAYAKDPLLVPLLRTCRDLPSATNELRWLSEHASKCATPRKLSRNTGNGGDAHRRLLERLCIQRGRGTPLQYLLGTEYFGDLELVCTPGVLIPRPETADIVTALAMRLRAAAKAGTLPDTLRILDLCTGTGCMALLLHSEVQKFDVESRPLTSTLGVDISGRAIQTARLNRRRLGFTSSWHTIRQLGHSTISFIRADVLGSSGAPPLPPQCRSTQPEAPPLDEILTTNTDGQPFDIVVSNPPYIGPQAFMTAQVEKSVRSFEPRIALVPPASQSPDGFPQDLDISADLFYPRILSIAHRVGAKVVLMEVGDREQALRVRDEARRLKLWDGADIWYDGVSLENPQTAPGGRERAVICWKGKCSSWLAKYDGKST